MNILKKNVTGVVIVAAIIFIAANFQSKKTLADSGQPNYITKMNVSTGVSVSSSTTDILDASSGRVYAIFVNDGSNTIYLSLNGAAAVAGKGIRLNASGGAYEINSLNQYIGQVNAITSSSSSNITVTASQ